MQSLVTLVLALLAGLTHAKLLHVTTLTRHGSRAPDKILAQLSCKPLLHPPFTGETTTQVIRSQFGTLPGELTEFGEKQMVEVGKFIRARYAQFSDANEYQSRVTDWEFIARAGSRQQRSMMAITHGLFPSSVAVPISVTDRTQDAVLGGPAPQCTEETAKMIVDWHATKGKQYVIDHYSELIPFETLCNVSLKDNPVNARPGGPNPHSWIGDVSDLLDSINENVPKKFRPNVSVKEMADLTQIAFDLEQKSHFDDPRGAPMFAGEFPNVLLKTFEGIVANVGKRPKGTPKMRLYACSRELEYGLSHLFDWEQGIRLPGEPEGRVKPGSTLIWELWQVDEDYFVDTFIFQPGNGDVLIEVQNRTSVTDYRKKYQESIKETGDWAAICLSSKGDTEIDVEKHGPMFWFAVLAVVGAVFVYVWSRSRRGYVALE